MSKMSLTRVHRVTTRHHVYLLVLKDRDPLKQFPAGALHQSEGLKMRLKLVTNGSVPCAQAPCMEASARFPLKKRN